MAVIETLKDKAGVVFSSAGEINKLAIDKVEEIARINLSTASYFSDISIKQLRALSGIKNLETARKFTADSISLSGEVAKKLLDDSKTWMGLGADIKEKMTDLLSAKKDEVEPKKKPAPTKAA
jgi:phasin family protein